MSHLAIMTYLQQTASHALFSKRCNFASKLMAVVDDQVLGWSQSTDGSLRCTNHWKGFMAALFKRIGPQQILAIALSSDMD